jgi:CBS-domain-containing membrane protein
MTIIDKKFRGNAGRYFFQCGLATVTILIILALLSVKKNTAIIASLGATAFLVFGMPNSRSASTRRLLGGYAVGMIVGCLFSFVATGLYAGRFLWIEDFSYVVFAAFAVGGAILLMVITNTEHPPAAGIALGFVLNDWNYRTIIIIASAILMMAIAKRLLKSRMTDLV